MRNEIIVRFCIWDFEDVTHDQLTQIIGVTPDKIYVKGEKRNPNNPSGTAIFKRNGWLKGSPLDKYSSFEDQLNSLLDLIEPKIQVLAAFSQSCAFEFSCAMYVYTGNGESTPSMHLNERYNKVVKLLDVEFDLDLYCFSDEK
jgi:hypothetical protein